MDEGNLGIARHFYEQSLRIYRDLNTRQGVALTLVRLARVCLREGQTEASARLWASAEALREQIGMQLPPAEQENHAQEIAQLREMMGEIPFITAWSSARTAALDQAVRLALNHSS